MTTLLDLALLRDDDSLPADVARAVNRLQKLLHRQNRQRPEMPPLGVSATLSLLVYWIATINDVARRDQVADSVARLLPALAREVRAELVEGLVAGRGEAAGREMVQ